MTHIRWESYESITVRYEFRSTAAPASEFSRVPNNVTTASGPATNANHLLWMAPVALAAGAAIVREANRREMLPRLTGAVKRAALTGGTSLTRSLRAHPRPELGEGTMDPPLLESGSVSDI